MVKRHKRAASFCIGAIIEKNRRTRIGRMACNLCDHYIMGSPIYVIMLGLIGTVITTFDIVRIMNYKSSVRYSTRSRDDEIVPSDVERDLKLMTSILGIEHYTLIMLGAITEYPMLHTPWLLMQLCVIIVEIIVFFLRLFLDGLHIKRDEILLAVLMLHNWLQVENLYVNIICFATNCLSSISFESGSHLTLESIGHKSTTFGTHFRRKYCLKVQVLIPDVIAAFIATLFLAIGDKYKIPYCYIPWLINTAKGLVFCEGPTLLKLSRELMPHTELPTVVFLFATLLLYVSEICIWVDALTRFQSCWVDYCNRKKHSSVRIDRSLRETYVRLPHDADIKKYRNFPLKRLKNRGRSIDSYDRIESQSSLKIDRIRLKNTTG